MINCMEYKINMAYFKIIFCSFHGEDEEEHKMLTQDSQS
jgi:hypothetical protein